MKPIPPNSKVLKKKMSPNVEEHISEETPYCEVCGHKLKEADSGIYPETKSSSSNSAQHQQRKHEKQNHTHQRQPKEEQKQPQQQHNEGPVSKIPPPTVKKRRTKDWALEQILTYEIDDMAQSLSIIAERRRPVQLSIISILQGVVSSLWPTSTVEPYGSFSTGLSSASSDIDLLVRNWCDIKSLLNFQQNTTMNDQYPVTPAQTTMGGNLYYSSSMPMHNQVMHPQQQSHHQQRHHQLYPPQRPISSPPSSSSSSSSSRYQSSSPSPSPSPSSSSSSFSMDTDSRRTSDYLQIEQAFLLQLYQMLSQQRWIETIQIVPQTRVPVIKIKTAAVPMSFMDQGYKPIVWIDITLERPTFVRLPRTQPIQTSEFVRRLVRGFPAIKPLALVLKQLLVESGLNESYTGGLCSYGLVLMITHVIRREYERRKERKRRREKRRERKQSNTEKMKEKSNDISRVDMNDVSKNISKDIMEKEKVKNVNTVVVIETENHANGVRVDGKTEKTKKTKENEEKEEEERKKRQAENEDNGNATKFDVLNETKDKDSDYSDNNNNDENDDEENDSGDPPLGRLLLDFFEYYGEIFDANNEGISLERENGTFPRSNAFCSGSLVVQDPLALSNNVTGGCYGWNTLRNTFSVAALSMREAYSDLYGRVVHSLEEKKLKQESNVHFDMSVLGRMFGTNHHSHVIDHASKLWCPSEIPPPAARKSSINSVNSNNVAPNKSANGFNNSSNTSLELLSMNASLSIENTYLRKKLEKLQQIMQQNQQQQQKQKQDNLSNDEKLE
jgi:DNA polymerase sigma